jgi:hypothetical protein
MRNGLSVTAVVVIAIDVELAGTCVTRQRRAGCKRGAIAKELQKMQRELVSEIVVVVDDDEHAGNP